MVDDASIFDTEWGDIVLAVSKLFVAALAIATVIVNFIKQSKAALRKSFSKHGLVDRQDTSKWRIAVKCGSGRFPGSLKRRIIDSLDKNNFSLRVCRGWEYDEAMKR
jgi:hypothetical protein